MNEQDLADVLDEALRVPYVMDVQSLPDEKGQWVCHLRYEELPGCSAMSPDPLRALDELEAKRVAWITAEISAGRTVQPPRAALGRY